MGSRSWADEGEDERVGVVGNVGVIPDAQTPAVAIAYRQVTDARLPTLAIHNGGCLATFDRGVADLTPESTPAAVELIP